MSYTLAYTGAEIDALLGKIDAIFVAEYGSTIYSEVTAAIAAGNKVIVANAGKVFVYAGTDDNSGYVFTQAGPNASKPNATYVTLSTGNVWSTATVDLATLQQFYASLMEDTASGSIASFPDGAQNVPVTELTADIEPIQDLHGYDNPWPPAGNKNKLCTTLAGAKANNTAGTWSGNSYTVNGVTFELSLTEDGYVTSVKATGTATANTAFRLGIGETNLIDGETYTLSGCPANGSSTTYECGVVTSTTPTQWDMGSGFTFTLNGTFSRAECMVRNGYAIPSGGIIFYPQIETGNAKTTFAPYSNICPIEGYPGAEITVAGKNLLSGDKGQYNPTIVNLGTTETDNGYHIPLKAGTYTFSGAGVTGVNWYMRKETDATNTTMTLPYTFTLTEDANVRFWIFKSGSAAPSDVTWYQLELGNEATSYHAYNGQTYSVDWTDEAGTVYKGELNATTGELTVTHANIDLSARTWTLTSWNGWRSDSVSDMKQGPITDLTDFFCDTYKPSTYGQINGGAAIGIALGGSSSNFKAVFVYNADTVNSPTGHLVYPLATPQTYQLTPTEVTTLLGDNNIFSSTGNVSVRYRCNTALYIEKKLGE